MAYQYDELGNVIGEYESEEERKKREELASTAVHTQEVKTYGDGTTERITKEQLPATPTMTQVGAPVNPEIYQRMLQTESGNKDYTAGGQPMTSNKGALFASQVMPATAAAPGYGIAPAAAQTPEEYNRVGREYYDAMLKHFGGDERKAAAAYNAGPGAVQKNITANAGQMNEAQLPKETQGYLGKVFGGVGQAVNAIMPSAQAGTLPPGQAQRPATISQPVAPTAPTAMPQPMQQAQPTMTVDDQGNKTITNPDGTTTVLGPDNRPLMAGGQVPADTAQYKQRLFDEAGKDPFKWMQISQDASQPAGVTAVAKEHARNLLQQDFQMQAAKEQVTKTIAAATSGDAKAGRAIADELKNQNGSWAKMILLGFLSPQLAGEEAVKLGFGNKWQSVTDDKGNTALIQVNAKGLPLKGISSDNTELTPQQLAGYATGGNRKLDLVGGSYVNDKTGEVGRMVSDQKTGQTYIQTDAGRKPMTGFRPQSTTGGLSDQRARQIQEINLKLQGKTEEEKMAILRPYNQQLVGAGMQAIDPGEVGIRAPQIGGGQPAGAVAPTAMTPSAAPAAAAPGGAVAPVPLAQAPAGRAAVPGARPTMTQIEAGKTAAKEIATEAGKTVAASADTQNMISSIDNKVIPILDSGKHNIGSELSAFAGRGPIAQSIGRQFETEDAKNTKLVLDTVNKLAVEGMKALGSNPSTVDLKFWTENKPQANSDPDFMKEWIESRSAELKRKLGYAEKQVGAGGSAGNAPAVQQPKIIKLD